MGVFMYGHGTVGPLHSMVGVAPLPTVLLEPDALARRAVETLLAAHGYPVVAAVACGQEALSVLQARQVGLLVTEIALPDLPLHELVRCARQGQAAIRIVVVTGEGDGDVLVDTLQAGVAGILSKYTPPGDLMPRVARTFNEGIILDEITGPAVRAALAGRNGDVPALPAREREVLELVHLGLSTAGISRRLGLAESTVKSHAAKAAARLGKRTSKEAAEAAARRGLLARPDT
jgi:DNA-binding NarL/FixJ family response regulator